jgi:predicted phage terminase large subunit-like protein
VNDEIIWGNSREELIEKHGSVQLPKSFTFIPSSVHDNKILMEKDPSYLSNLMALSRVERLRLLGGNWDVRPTAGAYFQKENFEIIDTLPAGWIRCIRYWDRAATKPNETNKNPDWTRGCKMYKYPDGTYVIADMVGVRDTPLQVEKVVKNTATQDGHYCRIGIEQDPGSAGVADADNFVRLLVGYDVRVYKPTADKVTRALPLSAQCERKNVKLLRGSWNDAFLSEAENFPPEEGNTVKKKTDEDAGKDDQIDAASGAFNELASDHSAFDAL